MSNFYTRLQQTVRCTLTRNFIFLSLLTLTFSSAHSQMMGTHLSYDGTDDYLVLPNNIVTGVTGDFTIETYIYFRGGNNLFQRIVDIGTSTSDWIALTANSNFGSFGPRFAISVGGNIQSLDATIPLPLNTWTHLAVTLDGTTGLTSLYINGTLNNTTTLTHRLSSIGATNNNRIGESKFSGDPYLNAQVEEMRFSNSVRYTANFTPPLMEFTPDANTVALFHFNEGMGQNTADASGNFPGGATLGSNPVAVDAADPSWISGSVLPLKLTSFNAQIADNQKQVQVQWIFVADNQGAFIVERSANGSVFEPVHTQTVVSASGNSQNFSFTDNNPLPGRSFYRLKFLENGQAAVYSKIIPVTFDAGSVLLVYPNPVRGNVINIELVKAATGQVDIKLFNAAGGLVGSKRFQATGQRQFTFNRSTGLPAGNYNLEITVNGNKMTRSILFQ